MDSKFLHCIDMICLRFTAEFRSLECPIPLKFY